MAYQALELGQSGNPKCPDKYNAESTLLCPNAKRLMLQTSTNAVMVQLGIRREGAQGVGSGLGSIQWQQELPFLPMLASLGRRFDAIRVRNYAAGNEAQVLISVET